ncbi:MAG TPA: GAF domain-containing protein [Rhodocyclaceae bacterium]
MNRIEHLRACFEGAIPSLIATCAADGTPNVAWLSQVQYVDGRHVALSFQFFNKTRANVLANPLAEVIVSDPATAANHRLQVRYCRTETAGPLFENMKARLSGVASHTGMSEVFRLQGADIYEVLTVTELPGARSQPARQRPARLPALRAASARLAACHDLDGLLNALLDALDQDFAISHGMVLMADAGGERLYTVASRGYPASGAGFEVGLGEGIVGVAARERTPIRISFGTAEYSYARAARASAVAAGAAADQTVIPFPGLADPRSQLALPILGGDRLHGVIYLESGDELRFDYDDEDALMALAHQLATAIAGMECDEAEPDQVAAPAAASGAAVKVRHYGFDHSVFLDGDYVIKGVAGAVLWRLLQQYGEDGRVEFSNRELRLDPALGLPEVGDNLEARLLLLQRRLADRQACVQLEKAGRGRLRLRLNRPLLLEHVERPA